MARVTVTKITDDFDGTDDAESVGFALDGVEYSVDLNAANKAKLVSALQPFMEAGTGRFDAEVMEGTDLVCKLPSAFELSTQSCCLQAQAR